MGIRSLKNLSIKPKTGIYGVGDRIPANNLSALTTSNLTTFQLPADLTYVAYILANNGYFYVIADGGSVPALLKYDISGGLLWRVDFDHVSMVSPENIRFYNGYIYCATRLSVYKISEIDGSFTKYTVVGLNFGFYHYNGFSVAISSDKTILLLDVNLKVITTSTLTYFPNQITSGYQWNFYISTNSDYGTLEGFTFNQTSITRKFTVNQQYRFFRVFAGASYIWTQDNQSARVYVYRASDGGFIAGPSSFYGETFSPLYCVVDEPYLYAHFSTMIYKIDTTTTVSYSFALPSNCYPRKMILIGNYLYVISDGSDKIYKLNKSNMTKIWEHAMAGNVEYYFAYDTKTGVMLTHDGNWLKTAQEYYQVLA